MVEHKEETKEETCGTCLLFSKEYKGCIHWMSDTTEDSKACVEYESIDS